MNKYEMPDKVWNYSFNVPPTAKVWERINTALVACEFPALQHEADHGGRIGIWTTEIDAIWWKIRHHGDRLRLRLNINDTPEALSKARELLSVLAFGEKVDLEFVAGKWPKPTTKILMIVPGTETNWWNLGEALIDENYIESGRREHGEGLAGIVFQYPGHLGEKVHLQQEATSESIKIKVEIESQSPDRPDYVLKRLARKMLWYHD